MEDKTRIIILLGILILYNAFKFIGKMEIKALYYQHYLI